MIKKTSIVCLILLPLLGVTAIRAEVTQDDIRLLGLIFRNRFVPYSQQEGASPLVKEIAETAGRRGASGSNVERYQKLIKGMMIMTAGVWDEPREVATIMDMRLPAKLFEPGDTVNVKVFPIYPYEGELKSHYMVHARLLDARGETVGEPGMMHYHELEAEEIPLQIPPDLAPGRYSVQYMLEKHHGTEGPILQAERYLFVLSHLGSRLEALAEMEDEIAAKNIGSRSERHKLAADTVAWHLAIYQKGVRENVAGAYTNHPIFMASTMTQAGMAFERIDFTKELDLAEELAKSLLADKDPLKTRTGDMRLAYTSPADGELVPFRIFVPEGYDPAKSYPLVMGLHGAGGDENSFMDRYEGLFKENAQKRGYIVASANGRGPYGGYRGDSGKDPLDVIALIQRNYPIEKTRTYLTGHSMGGFGTVALGFNNPETFAALAMIAGFGTSSQLEKSKDMPILIAQGSEDALVPVASARSFHEAAKKLGMPHVKYIELEGVDHIQIATLVMNDIFDWFDSHSK